MAKRFLIFAIALSSLCATAQRRYSPSIAPVSAADRSGAALGSAAPAPPGPHLSSGTTSAEVRIAPGDLLEIGVFDAPEFNCKVRVSSDGTISFPLIGSVPVATLTPQRAEESIEKRLIEGEFVRNPQVSVFVAEYATQTVYVIGEVTRPGPYPLLGTHRLLDAIAVAGGLTPRAGKTAVIRHDAATHVIPLTTSLSPEGNPEVVAGDTIQVNAAGIAYVLGDVTRPGGFVLERDDGLTVLRLLALAEGTKTTASLRNARLIRSAGRGTHQEIALDLKKIFKGESADVAVQDGDILFVPGNLAKGAAKRGMEAIVQTATGVVIYRR